MIDIYIRNREESLEQLSQMLKPEQMKKLITQEYTDTALSVMADFKKEYAESLASSSFSAKTINKLTEAYAQDKLSAEDLLMSVKYTAYTKTNEPYVNDFLNSVDEGVFHETAAKTFAAVNYEDCSYAEAIGLVKSGAFEPTDYASLSVTKETAIELEDMEVSLRGCHGFNGCYDITDVSEALEKGNAVFVSEKYLAVMVNDMRKLPDWEQFKDSVKYIMGRDINELTGSKLADLHTDYVRENNSIALYDKVKSEYDSFIDNMKKEPAENIIGSAYEIVKKEDITLYCQEYTPELTDKQYSALMSSKNTLDEVYEQWCNNGELHSLDYIGIALEETADRIQTSIDREKQLAKAVPMAKKEPVPELKQEQAVKTKHKAR